MKTILRLVTVIDTREWSVGPDGAFPIPGSGVMNECARCGAQHEIHAHVELSDGTRAIMGDTCATREAAHLGAAIKDAKAHAVSLAKAQAKLAGLYALAAEWKRYEAMVCEERGLRSFDRGLYYELRHRTAGHFSSKGMRDWYMPPMPADFAKAKKAVERIEKKG